LAGYGTDRGPMRAPRPGADDGCMTESSLSSQTAALPPAGRYRINPGRSTVTFRTRHLFGLAPVHGTFALRDGTIDVTEPPAGCSVRARVAASTFKTGNDMRDAAVLSARLLDAATYPNLAFTSTALISEPGPAPAAGQWLLCGELEVRGVSRPVEAHISSVSVGEGGTTLAVTARLSLDRYEFGLTAYRGLAARRLTIDLGIRADKTTGTERTRRP
jgi:polyisoprenoid-binding protein YceI